VLLGIAGMFRVRPTRGSPRADRRSRCPSCRRTCAPTTSPRSFHNLLVGGRTEEAKAIHAETAEVVQASGDANAAFAFALAENVTAYVDGRYDEALEMTEQAARAGSGTTDWARERLAQEWRCETRTVLDHVDDSLRPGRGRHRGGPARPERLGRSASSRSGVAGSCISWAGSTTPARSSKGSSARRAAIASSAPSTPPASSPLGRVALHQGNRRLQQRTARLARGPSRGQHAQLPPPGGVALALQAMATDDFGPRTHRCAPSARTSAPRSCRSSRST
jgi:hypothetical protein